jgi:IS30 family transposase
METRLTYTYWKDGPYFVGYLNEYPDDSTQGLTQRQLDRIIEKLNNRPRKALGYRTPNEVFSEHLFALQT